MKRKIFLVIVIIIVAAVGFFLGVLHRAPDEEEISTDSITAFSGLTGLKFTDDEKELMLEDLKEHKESYMKIRKVKIDNSVPPARQFNPIPADFIPYYKTGSFKMSSIGEVNVPDNKEALAFYSVMELAELIRTRKITSTELTNIYLDRLKKYGDRLKCVITLTEDLALKQAKRADDEIAAGKYRGPLHGIPYGLKDLLSVKGYKTTWGAMPYKDQVIDENSTVYMKLRDAGAVLVAKLSMGALAWGDVWYGGTTKNPWNLEEGSSGSSAGSAAATAAGLVGFSIGTETWGSIVSPSTRCGDTGLRPTFGRVSRAGVMALSWSMDKIGPICRTVEDCAIVFNYIYGPDGIDQSVIDMPYSYNPSINPEDIRMGYLKTAFDEEYDNKSFDQETLQKLRELGFELIPIELTEYPVEALSFILYAEAAAAFDELTRSNRDDMLVRQVRYAWPNVFRHARLIPAVEYIQANRIRKMIIEEMSNIMNDIDLYVAPSFGGNNLLLTNLTGHPCIVLPNGFKENGSPVSISFIGRLYDEGRLLAITRLYQNATAFHLKHPVAFKPR